MAIYMNGRIKGLILCCIMMCVVVLSGCSSRQDDFTKNGFTLLNDNSIDAVIVEDFSAEYYQLEDLMQFVNEDVAEYNATLGTTAVTVGEYSLENGVVRLNLSFQDVDAYNGYMPDKIFVGNLQGAYDSGYSFDRVLNVAGKDGSTIAKEDLLNMGNAKVIVLVGDLSVRCPSKILYYSAGMTLLDDNTVSADAEGDYFIIYK